MDPSLMTKEGVGALEPSGSGIFSTALRKFSAPAARAPPPLTTGHAGFVSRQRSGVSFASGGGDILSATTSLSARAASAAGSSYAPLGASTPLSAPPVTSLASFIEAPPKERVKTASSAAVDVSHFDIPEKPEVHAAAAAGDGQQSAEAAENDAPGSSRQISGAAFNGDLVTFPSAEIAPGIAGSAAPSFPSAPAPLASAAFYVRGFLRHNGKPWDDAASYPPLRMARFSRCLESKMAGVANPGLASTLLGGDLVDLETLRALAWSGAPSCYRIATWQTLLGYLPLSRSRQPVSMSKKRLEYQQSVRQYYLPVAGSTATPTAASSASSQSQGPNQIHKSDAEQALLRQVLVDVPRTNPGIGLFRLDFIQRSLERVLYVWAMRHPASGYVQGINDLATPFYAVFLSPWLDTDACMSVTTDNKGGDTGVRKQAAPIDLTCIPPAALLEVEADVYWCLTKLLEGIQDHYTPSQPGIQRMIFRLRELVHRIDEKLVAHLEACGVEFYTFAFRWMNCLLMRELPFKLVVRLWDTCLAERDGFDVFYVYVCAALLVRFAPKLKTMRFQELVTFLQRLSAVTRDWSAKELEELLAQAYIYKALFTAAHMSA